MLVGCGLLACCIPDSSGPDSVCQWPRDSVGPLDLSDPRQSQHLSNDAQIAEDLAIRYADGHSRPGTGRGHSMGEYLQTLDQCTIGLFQVIAEHHKVTPQQVRESINKHRHTSVDAMVMLFFGLAYGLFVDGFVWRIWLRFPPKHDRLLGILATVVISPVVSLLGVVFGEFWANAAEVLRIGYGHLVDRVDRIPWVNHRTAIFAAGILVFWVLSWRRYREGGSGSDTDSAVLGLLDPPSVALPNKED